MRILLRLELDCAPDAAWRAVNSPAVMKKVASPFLRFESLEAAGFPKQWAAGEHRVLASALGLVEMGSQTIAISYPRRRDGVRVVRDSGPSLTGPLSLVTQWRHQMAISPSPGGRTLYRDELRFGAGLLTPLMWPALWLFWQWRALRLTQLATKWR